MNSILKRLKAPQIIALGFLIIILIGTLVLMLPISSRNGSSASFSDASFTAVSASCVTGLVVQDTFSYWSPFGQVVILLLIQIGGLGFMTFATLFSMVIGRKIGLKERGIIKESVNTAQIGGVVRLTRKIAVGTALFEGIGALLLCIRFIPQMGIASGIYNAVFHSVSAFCNAGFDLMGKNQSYSSLTAYRGDVLVNIVIMALIVVGGIGFVVWDDIGRNRLHFKKYQVHSKIVLITTAVLILGGAALFFIFEVSSTVFGNSTGEKWLASFFQSITTRTAGFNTADIAALSPNSKLLTILLMFVGGSPGSTAGGIKTTTLVVLLLCLRSSFKRTQQLNVYKRRLEPDVTRKAVCVFTTNLFFAITATLVICAQQNLDLVNVMVETFSAIGTVGMSAGITRDLTAVSKAALMVCMFCGRVGSLSFALSFASDKPSPVLLPETKINIG